MIIDKLTRLNQPFQDSGEWVQCYCQHSHHGDQKIGEAGINTESGIHSCFKDHSHNFPFVSLTDDSSEDEEDLLWRARYSSFSEHTEDEDDIWIPIHQPPLGELVQEDWRGISKELLKELFVSHCTVGKYQGRYIFPIYKDGMSVGFDSRIVDNTARMSNAKWLRPKGMRASAIVYPLGKVRSIGSSHLVICEGVMDALSYIQMGIPAICNFGISPPHQQRIEQLIALGIESVTLAFDNDDAGRAGMLTNLPHYSKWFDIVSHPMVDMVRNSGHKDANQFLTETLTNGLKQTETWDNDEI